MAVKKQFQLTKEGSRELQAELDKLVGERSAVAGRIKTAREFGDLSENSEYQAARDEHERNENRIAEVENILHNSEVIVMDKDTGVVGLGSSVKLQSATGKAKELQVVGTVEADPLNGRISDESPIGQALLGKKQGDDVEIKTPAETTTYKVVAIS